MRMRRPERRANGRARPTEVHHVRKRKSRTGDGGNGHQDTAIHGQGNSNSTGKMGGIRRRKGGKKRGRRDRREKGQRTRLGKRRPGIEAREIGERTVKYVVVYFHKSFLCWTEHHSLRLRMRYDIGVGQSIIKYMHSCQAPETAVRGSIFFN